MTSNRGFLAAGLAILALAGVGCGGEDDAGSSAEAEPAEVPVEIQTFMFDPDPVEVEAGAAVRWTNRDEILHTVSAGSRRDPNAAFDHELDGVGATARQTFERRGTFDYFCSVHDGMDGRVIVR